MSQVGIPIKLLYEAEGMKVTVEVGLLVYIICRLYPLAFIVYIVMLNYVHILCTKRQKDFSRLSTFTTPPYIYPVQIYYMIWIDQDEYGCIWRDLHAYIYLEYVILDANMRKLKVLGFNEFKPGMDYLD